MPASDFLKDLPSQNKANFSSMKKQKQKPVITHSTEQTSDEKKIICEKRPMLLRYLQSTWEGNSAVQGSGIRTARSDRKRTSNHTSPTTEEAENAEAARTKTRRRE